MEPSDFKVSDRELFSILKMIPKKINNKEISIHTFEIYKLFRSDPELYKQNFLWRHCVYDLVDTYNDFVKSEKDSNDYKTKQYQLYVLIYHLYEISRQIHSDRGDSDYNSKDFYENQISTLEQKIIDLNQQLSESKRTKEQKEELTKDLEITKEQLEQAKSNNAELEKRLDAQQNIKEKISIAFSELKTHISHLKNEKTRLNWMFGIYAFLSFVVFVMLIIFELKYLSKWETPTNWIDYLPFYIPVPIVGGLMWAFIYQMNRAQRQLIFVANELYHVDYVEGLLQAINLISPDAASASEKISHVLDILIKKHISIPEGLFENSLDKEISKDTINVDTFIDLAKKVKDVVYLEKDK